MRTEWFESSRLGEKYCRIDLPGKPTIYVFPKDMTNICALCATRYGSTDRYYKSDEGKIITLPDGIAHFLEHTMFNQEDGRSAFEIFSALGADANAYTSYDRTVFYFNCISNFDESFRLLLNMVTHPYFTKENVDKERGIIAQEIGMYDDEPESVCYQNMLDSLYRSHPIKAKICGTVGSIKKITPELLYDCHRRFYTPGNMIIAVCGRVTPEDVAQIVGEEWQTDDLPAPSKIMPEEFDAPVKKEIVGRMRVSMPIFNIGFKERSADADLSVRCRRDIAVAVLERMLLAQSGELYNELFDKGLMSAPLSAERYVEDSVAFSCIGGMANDPATVCDYIMSYIDKKRKSGLDFDDFVRSRRTRLSRVISRFDSTEEIANCLLDFVFDGLDLFDDCEMTASLGFDEVNEVFETVYSEEDMTRSLILPLR